MNRPSRGEVEFATTMRYEGRFLQPVRRSRILTGKRCSSEYLTHKRELKAARAFPAPLHVRDAVKGFAHLRELVQEAVHLLNGGAAAGRDAPEATAIDDRGVVPLLARHRLDHRLHAVELTLVDLDLLFCLERGKAGDRFQDLVQRPHLA